MIKKVRVNNGNVNCFGVFDGSFHWRNNRKDYPRMKSYRKLTLKSVIDYTVVFTVGVIVGLLVKPKRKRIDEWDWEYWLKTRPLVYDSSGDMIGKSWFGKTTPLRIRRR